MTNAVIEVQNLVKTYGDRQVVADLNLTVCRGEVFALLGPNAAGKTTTIEILEGYRRPDAGTVRVLGLDPLRDGGRLKSRIGIMPQESGLYPAITPAEALRLFARFYRDPYPPEELLDLAGLRDAAGTRYRRLSGGQKQRLSLALALLPRPELIFLDEPTAGMDPQARRGVWEIVERLQAEGVTVMLTTHYLEEAERLADRIAIIDRGRLIALDTPAALIGGETAVRVRTASPLDPSLLASLPHAGTVRADGTALVVETGNPPELLVEVATALRDHGIAATELRIGGGTLEDVFLQLTGREFEV